MKIEIEDHELEKLVGAIKALTEEVSKLRQQQPLLPTYIPYPVYQVPVYQVPVYTTPVYIQPNYWVPNPFLPNNPCYTTSNITTLAGN